MERSYLYRTFVRYAWRSCAPRSVVKNKKEFRLSNKEIFLECFQGNVFNVTKESVGSLTDLLWIFITNSCYAPLRCYHFFIFRFRVFQYTSSWVAHNKHISSRHYAISLSLACWRGRWLGLPYFLCEQMKCFAGIFVII